ncbi:unnamed protein product [Polarella glacialis]|uniref:Uncharacterized protein n=1 Tax=Polarella glacialis TaxID=89957 RepID=A0A813LVH0_POLGL|nr:unnamed protein product [Polarella glacialis]
MAGPLRRWLGNSLLRSAGPSALPGNVGLRPNARQRVQWCSTFIQPSKAEISSSARKGSLSRSTPQSNSPSNLQCTHASRRLDACAPGLLDLDKLERIIADARQAASTPRNPRSSSRRPTSDGKWLCVACQRFLPTCDFNFRPKSLRVPVRPNCRECERCASLKFARTLRGSSFQLVYSARSRSIRRGHICSLLPDDVLDMLWTQKGRCAYSGIVLEVLTPNSHWRWSLERKNNSRGYCLENCLLIAAEFNTSDYSRRPGVLMADVIGTAQWSAEKARYVLSAGSLNIDLVQLSADIDAAGSPGVLKRLPRHPRLPNAAGEFTCCKCKQYKPTEAFNKDTRAMHGLYAYCKDCAGEKDRRHRGSLRGQAFNMIRIARQRSRVRGQEFILSADDILDMLRSQGGRCYYSQVPLQYQRLHTDWRMSLERLDNSVGYTKDNSVLTAIEFNTPDYSRNKAVTQVYGTAQWSRAKVAHVWGQVHFES